MVGGWWQKINSGQHAGKQDSDVSLQADARQTTTTHINTQPVGGLTQETVGGGVIDTSYVVFCCLDVFTGEAM